MLYSLNEKDLKKREALFSTLNALMIVKCSEQFIGHNKMMDIENIVMNEYNSFIYKVAEQLGDDFEMMLACAFAIIGSVREFLWCYDYTKLETEIALIEKGEE